MGSDRWYPQKRGRHHSYRAVSSLQFRASPLPPTIAVFSHQNPEIQGQRHPRGGDISLPYRGRALLQTIVASLHIQSPWNPALYHSEAGSEAGGELQLLSLSLLRMIVVSGRVCP